MTPGERVRAAAISSRPTCAMNTTAGSAAAAGAETGGALAASSMRAAMQLKTARLQPRVPSTNVPCAVPVTPVMRRISPSNIGPYAPARECAALPTTFDHETRAEVKELALAG